MDYRAERAGLARFLRSSPELQAVLHARAEVGAAAARAAAPVDSGEYKASIHVEDGGVEHGRMSADIVADARYAADVEFRRGSRRPLGGAGVNGAENG